MTLDPTKRFSDRAENYRKYRPHYPKEVMDALQTYIPADKQITVADIGSGTGIFTKEILDLDFEVYAIEPNKEMRQIAEQDLSGFPKFHSIEGTAENTTLPDDSIDLITAAQAFHWFQLDPTLKEFQRILKAEGLIAYVWNARDDAASEFLQEYEKLIVEYCPEYQLSAHVNIGRDDLLNYIEEVSLEEFHFTNSQEFDKEGFLGRVFSSSYTPAENSPNYTPFKEALEALFDKYNENGYVKMIYNTHLFLGRVLWFT